MIIYRLLLYIQTSSSFICCGLWDLSPSLQRGVQGPHVDTGQSEPRQRELPPCTVILELDIEVEIPSVEEEQSSHTDRALFGLHLVMEERESLAATFQKFHSQSEASRGGSLRL